MKNLSLLLLFIFTSLFSTAQEFTPPDSAAIIKNKVKSVKIFYTGKGKEHLIKQEYRYDKMGRCIYSRVGTVPYYYTYSYTEKGQPANYEQRTLTGGLIKSFQNVYAADGKLLHMKILTERDSINPSTIYTYDADGRTIEENYFEKGVLTRSYKTGYDSAQVIHRIDSTPGKSVYEKRDSKTIRQTYYNEKNEVQENWLLNYDIDNNLIATECTIGKNKGTYTMVYTDRSLFAVLKNGQPIIKDEFISWNAKFHYLLPRPIEGDVPLPFIDPASQYEFVHQLKRDRKNNITRDFVSCKYSMENCPDIHFDYEYKYW